MGKSLVAQKLQSQTQKIYFIVHPFVAWPIVINKNIVQQNNNNNNNNNNTKFI